MNSTFQSTSTYSTKVLYDVHKGEKKRIHEILVTQMGFKFSQKHIDYKAPVSVMIADAVLNMIEIPPKILSVVNNTTNKIYLDDEQYKLRIRKGQMNKLVCYENKTYRPFFARLTVDAKLGGYYTHSSCKGEGKRKKHYVNTKKCQLLFPSHKVWSLMKKYNIDDVIATMKMDGHLNEEGEFRNIFTLLNDEFIKKQFDKKTTKYTSNGIIVSTSQRNTSNLNGEYVHYQIQCNTPPSFIGICNTTENILFGIDAKGKVLNANKTFENLKYDENKNLNIILDYYDIDNCKLFIYYGNIPHFDYKCIIGSKKIQMVYDNIPSGAYKLCIAFSNNYGVAELQHCQIYGSASAQFDEFSITKENDINLNESRNPKKTQIYGTKNGEFDNLDLMVDNKQQTFDNRPSVNQQEKQAIDRLKAMGVSEHEAQEAYIACGENADQTHTQSNTSQRKTELKNRANAILVGILSKFESLPKDRLHFQFRLKNDNSKEWHHSDYNTLGTFADFIRDNCKYRIHGTQRNFSVSLANNDINYDKNQSRKISKKSNEKLNKRKTMSNFKSDGSEESFSKLHVQSNNNASGSENSNNNKKSRMRYYNNEEINNEHNLLVDINQKEFRNDGFICRGIEYICLDTKNTDVAKWPTYVNDYGCNYVRMLSEHAPNDLGKVGHSTKVEFRYTDTLNAVPFRYECITVPFCGGFNARQIDTLLRKDSKKKFTNISEHQTPGCRGGTEIYWASEEESVTAEFIQWLKTLKEKTGSDSLIFVPNPSLVEVNGNNNNENDIEMINESNAVTQWLHNVVKLPQYVGMFLDNGFDDMDTIRYAFKRDNYNDKLKEIGITKMGHQEKIMMKIDEIKK